MATYQITAPENFNFNRPEEWPRWIRKFERFRLASGLSEKEEASQVNALIYTMGDDADDILGSLGLSEEDKGKYDVVKDKFQAHFVKNINVIYERAKFNRRCQHEGETVDQFVTALHTLAEHCSYGPLKEEMIRDRLVVGLRDGNLSLKLQMDPKLTLKTAVATASQNEMVRKQQSTVRPAEQPPNIDLVVYKKQYPQQGRLVQPTQPNKFKTCDRCGKSPSHSRQECPAREAICHRCSKKGHYSVVCRTAGSIRMVQYSPVREDVDEFLGAIETESTAPNKSWTVPILLNGISFDFKIDTGADVTVIPETIFKQIKSIVLQPCMRSLSGPCQNNLTVCGQFRGTLKHGPHEVQQDIFVIQHLHKPLLGLPAIQALQLVSRVNAVGDLAAQVSEKYPQLFGGLGSMTGEHIICLNEDAKPFAISTPRRIALPLLPKVKSELERMEKLGVIRRVNVPTKWCTGMVVVPKPDGRIRICVDLTKLNQNVQRERHPIPSVDHTLAQLGGAQIFSKLDANSGFWQVHLQEDSALLTTFITPFGRFCYNRLPFGITSAPEYFQKRMHEVLLGLEGVICMMDDILVYGCDQEEHNSRLMAVLERLKQAGVTLNKDKCSFSVDRVTFLGHVIDKAGVHPDPKKVEAIQLMTSPRSPSDVRRFLGMVTQLGKFTHNLAETSKPLRDLLGKKNAWCWDEPQETAFQAVKRLLISTPALSFYSPERNTIVSADASSYGLGSVLLQKQPDNVWKPIAYASRALTSAEQKYAQIEKEALAVTWSCERFNDYLLGTTFHIHTDHKPLVPLLSTKNLDELPIRIQRFRMRLMRYSFTISHVAGKDLVTADTLSRAPVSTPSMQDEEHYHEVEAYVSFVYQNLPASDKRIDQIKEYQSKDEICQQLAEYCKHGWPNKSEIPCVLKPYFSIAGEITMQNELLMRGSRIIIPPPLRSDILERLHTGHLGISKCRERARNSVWWPNLSKQLADLVENCTTCCKFQKQPSEPLIPSVLPTLPWQKVASDLFKWKGATYLLVVDYFSKYIEISKLDNETSHEVVIRLKSIFARHGIPLQVFSDNGPQYSSTEFSEFAKLQFCPHHQ